MRPEETNLTTSQSSRRSFLAAGTGALAFAATAPAVLAQSAAPQPAGGEWRPAQRYPDAAIEILDPAFEKYRLMNARIERLATGFRWAEGPVWFGDHRCVLFSDIPNNRIMRWEELPGQLSVFREPANNSNGNTRDQQGRLVTCEHEQRRITRTEYDGSITVLADRFEGKRLNSPNDVVCGPDGSIWFSDPPFGLSLYEGNLGTREQQHENVYRVDAKTGAVSAVIENLNAPNGLCFSPDGSRLYVVESRAKPNRLIWAYDMREGTRVENPRVLIDCGRGSADGLRCDQDGNLWCGWGGATEDLDGVMIFSPQGKAIGRIRLPERGANLCFGGPKNNRLYIAASQSLYALFVNTRGATKC